MTCEFDLEDELPDEPYTLTFTDGRCRTIIRNGDEYVFVDENGIVVGEPAVEWTDLLDKHEELVTLDTEVESIEFSDIYNWEWDAVLDAVVVADGTPLQHRWNICGWPLVHCGFGAAGRKGQVYVETDDFCLETRQGEIALRTFELVPGGPGEATRMRFAEHVRLGVLGATVIDAGEPAYTYVGDSPTELTRESIPDTTWLLVMESTIGDDDEELIGLAGDNIRYLLLNDGEWVRWEDDWTEIETRRRTPDWEVPGGVWDSLARTRIEVRDGAASGGRWKAWVPCGPAESIGYPEHFDDRGVYVVSACNPACRELDDRANAERMRTLWEILCKHHVIDEDPWDDEGGMAPFPDVRPGVSRCPTTSSALPSWALETQATVALDAGRYADQVAVFRLNNDSIDVIACWDETCLRIPCEVVDALAPSEALSTPEVG